MATKTDIIARKQLEDILLDVSWARIARAHFGKSSSWIYN